MEIIKIQEITKSYKSILALNKVSLSIQEGEIYGLLGVNGAGKTTLIKILTGLTQPDSGSATISGYDLTQMKELQKIINISPQETAIALNLTVKENLKFFQELYDIIDEGYLNEIITAFCLDEVLNQRAKTLSGGWQRRLSIAIGLITNPKILFLDEPTLGLDVLARRELWRIIENLKGKITIILTSHYLEEIEFLCNRVAVLYKGRLLSEGSIDKIKVKENEKSFEEAFIKLVEESKL